MTTISIELTGFELTGKIYFTRYGKNKKNSAWCVYCPLLGVASQAGSRDAALRNASEIIEIWFESCLGARNSSGCAEASWVGAEKYRHRFQYDRFQFARSPGSAFPKFRMTATKGRIWRGLLTFES